MKIFKILTVHDELKSFEVKANNIKEVKSLIEKKLPKTWKVINIKEN